jgi:methylmalonyl-CoA mutase C-terminal domain/subunit
MTHRAKIIVGLLGIDQHEVGAIAISSLLRDAGVEVIYLGRFNTPASLIRVALHEDADVIGVSCHSWEYLEYIPELMTMLRSEAIDVDVVLGGSVITAGDAETMRQAGVAATFGADSKPDQVVADIQALAAARQQRLRGDPRI